MSDLVGNPEDRFSQNEAHIWVKEIHLCYSMLHLFPTGSVGYGIDKNSRAGNYANFIHGVNDAPMISLLLLQSLSSFKK